MMHPQQGKNHRKMKENDGKCTKEGVFKSFTPTSYGRVALNLFWLQKYFHPLPLKKKPKKSPKQPKLANIDKKMIKGGFQLEEIHVLAQQSVHSVSAQAQLVSSQKLLPLNILDCNTKQIGKENERKKMNFVNLHTIVT